MTYPFENLENFTLPALLDRSVKLYGDNDIVGKAGEDAMRYHQFNKKVLEMVELLQTNGISKGDKVILLSENMPNWGIAYFSVTYFGAIIVPILPDFHPADVHHIIKHSEAKAVFVSEKYLPTIEDFEEDHINFVIKLDDLKLVDELTNQNYISKLANKISHSINHIEKPNEDDMASLLYTSGTTGHSKGVMLSHKNLVTNAMSTYTKITIESDNVFLSILPLAHTLECTIGFIIPILNGASIFYIDKAPTPSVLLKAFKVVKPTMMVSVPLIIEKIYKNKVLPQINSSIITKSLYKIPFMRKKMNIMAGKKLIEIFGGRLKFFGIGGAGLPEYVEQFLIESKFPYIVGYGLTETAPLLAASIHNGVQKIGSTGSNVAGVELKIKDIDPVTKTGEIIAKSPSVMLGYYKDKEKTDEVIDDGWFLTGDLGYIDDGYLFINGRSKNVIIGSGGENIYPEQIEARINENEVVLDSLVIMKDNKLIARVHLDYELIDKKFGSDFDNNKKIEKDIENLLEEMRLEVNSNISSFSRMVKFVEQVEPFTKTPTKKIKRYLYTE